MKPFDLDLIEKSIQPRRRSFLVGAGAGLFASGLPQVVRAQDKKEHVLRVVAQHRSGAQYKKWQWLETELPKRTNGRLRLEINTIPELGLTGTEVLRVLKTGLIDLAEVLTGYVAGDFPVMEATDLPGLVASTAQSRKIYDAWTEQFVVKREDMMGGRAIATFSYGTMPLFTKFALNNLTDLRGKKIRVFSPAQARYLTALGAEPLSMPIADVYSALQRGMMDGLITGFEWVSGMKMWEIAGHVSDINIAPLGCYIVASKKGWAKLPQDLQKTLLEIGPELTNRGWDLGQENVDEGTRLAKEHGMVITVPGRAEWHSALSKISAENIVPWWSNRAGPQGKDAFNQIIAPIVGFRVA